MFDKALLGFTEFYPVLSSFSGFYWAGAFTSFFPVKKNVDCWSRDALDVPRNLPRVFLFLHPCASSRRESLMAGKPSIPSISDVCRDVPEPTPDSSTINSGSPVRWFPPPQKKNNIEWSRPLRGVHSFIPSYLTHEPRSDFTVGLRLNGGRGPAGLVTFVGETTRNFTIFRPFSRPNGITFTSTRCFSFARKWLQSILFFCRSFFFIFKRWSRLPFPFLMTKVGLDGNWLFFFKRVLIWALRVRSSSRKFPFSSHFYWTIQYLLSGIFCDMISRIKSCLFFVSINLDSRWWVSRTKQ